MKLKNALACVAVASFALAQPAAAATRSYESLPDSGIQQAVSVDRAGAAVQDADALHGRGSALIILLIFAALLAIFAAAGAFGQGKRSTG